MRLLLITIGLVFTLITYKGFWCSDCFCPFCLYFGQAFFDWGRRYIDYYVPGDCIFLFKKCKCVDT